VYLFSILLCVVYFVLDVMGELDYQMSVCIWSLIRTMLMLGKSVHHLLCLDVVLFCVVVFYIFSVLCDCFMFSSSL